jgi:hypothetical protein
MLDTRIPSCRVQCSAKQGAVLRQGLGSRGSERARDGARASGMTGSGFWQKSPLDP